MSQASDSIVLEEEIDPEYEPSDTEVIEYAKWLGMDLEGGNDTDLLWIAKEGLKAPLPAHWKPCKTLDTKEIYYFNFSNGESTWDHPCDQYYRSLYEEEKKRRNNPSSFNLVNSNASTGSNSAIAREKEWHDVRDIVKQQKNADIDEEVKKKVSKLKPSSRLSESKPLVVGGGGPSSGLEKPSTGLHSLNSKNPLPSLRPKSSPRNDNDGLMQREGSFNGLHASSRSENLMDSYDSKGLGRERTSSTRRKSRRGSPRSEASDEDDYYRVVSPSNSSTGTNRQHRMDKETDRFEEQIRRLRQKFKVEIEQMHEKHEEDIDETQRQMDAEIENIENQFERQKRQHLSQNDKKIHQIEEDYDAQIEELHKEHEAKLKRERSRLQKELDIDCETMQNDNENRLRDLKQGIQEQEDDLLDRQERLQKAMKRVEQEEADARRTEEELRDTTKRLEREQLEIRQELKREHEEELKSYASKKENLQMERENLKRDSRDLEITRDEVAKQREKLAEEERHINEKIKEVEVMETRLTSSLSNLEKKRDGLNNKEEALKRQRDEIEREQLALDELTLSIQKEKRAAENEQRRNHSQKHQDLDSLLRQREGELDELESKISKLKRTHQELQDEHSEFVEDVKTRQEDLQEDYDNLQEKFESEKKRQSNVLRELKKEIEQNQVKRRTLELTRDKLAHQLGDLNEEEEKASKLQNELHTVQSELHSRQDELRLLQDELASCRAKDIADRKLLALERKARANLENEVESLKRQREDALKRDKASDSPTPSATSSETSGLRQRIQELEYELERSSVQPSIQGENLKQQILEKNRELDALRQSKKLDEEELKETRSKLEDMQIVIHKKQEDGYLLQEKFRELNSDRARLNQEVKSLQDKLEAAESDKSRMEREINDTEHQNNILSSRVQEEVEKTGQLEHEVSNLERQLEEKRSEMSNVASSVGQSGRLRDMEAENDRLRTQCKSLEKQVEDLSSESQKLSKDCTTFATNTSSLENKIALLREAVDEKDKELEVKYVEIENLERRLEVASASGPSSPSLAFQQKLQRLQDEFDKERELLQSQIDSLHDSEADSKRALSQSKVDIQSLTHKLAYSQEESLAYRNNVEKLSSEINKATMENLALRTEQREKELLHVSEGRDSSRKHEEAVNLLKSEYEKELFSVKQDLDNAEMEKRKLLSETKTLTERCNALSKSVQHIQEDANTRLEDVKQEATRTTTRLQARIDQERVNSAQSLNEVEERYESVVQEVEDARRSNRELSKKNAQLLKQIQEVENRYMHSQDDDDKEAALLTGELQRKNEELFILKSELQEVKLEKQRKDDMILSLQDKLQALSLEKEDKVKMMQRKLQELEERHRNEIRKFVENDKDDDGTVRLLQDRINDLSLENTKLRSEKEFLESEVSRVEQNIRNQVEQEKLIMQRDRDALEKQSGELKRKLAQVESKVSEFEQQRNSTEEAGASVSPPLLLASCARVNRWFSIAKKEKEVIAASSFLFAKEKEELEEQHRRLKAQEKEWLSSMTDSNSVVRQLKSTISGQVRKREGAIEQVRSRLHWIDNLKWKLDKVDAAADKVRLASSTEDDEELLREFDSCLRVYNSFKSDDDEEFASSVGEDCYDSENQSVGANHQPSDGRRGKKMYHQQVPFYGYPPAPPPQFYSVPSPIFYVPEHHHQQQQQPSEDPAKDVLAPFPREREPLMHLRTNQHVQNGYSRPVASTSSTRSVISPHVFVSSPTPLGTAVSSSKYAESRDLAQKHSEWLLSFSKSLLTSSRTSAFELKTTASRRKKKKKRSSSRLSHYL